MEIRDMTRTKDEQVNFKLHEKEWIKLSESYKSQAKVQNIEDKFFYRHRCIEGLLTGVTNDAPKSD